ncbi:hypothetical protein BROUX41_000484 [Berkeleyomyces rouxiae]|uniref:uncharacterized protein n=1 Tax=Berkeleyomyces rouxiae TaxID=2035830 RepID=UPI003B79F0E6
MASLVSEFIINPVLRQARRFSEISRPSVADLGGENEISHKDAGLPADSPEHSPGSDPGVIIVVDDSPNSESVSASNQLPSNIIQTDGQSTPLPPIHADGARYNHIAAQETRIPDNMSESSSRPSSPLSMELQGVCDLEERELPDDDGMAGMRMRIREIQNMDISTWEKGHLLHQTLMKSHLDAKALCSSGQSASGSSNGTQTWQVQKTLAVGSPLSVGPLSTSLASLKFWSNGDEVETFTLTEKDITPTFHTPSGEEEAYIGCKHYRRNIKLQCSTCNKWYTCRLCHDHHEDHELNRRETKNMLCMTCACPQRTSDTCVNCGTSAASYYCSICKLWEDRANKPIYHCNECGICRKGHGLGKDFFHCKTCNACISTSIQYSHKCIERATDCNCPICEVYLFTSRKAVVFMECGHSIHRTCHDKYLASGSYKCPLCSKAIINTEALFRSIDLAIQNQPMPEEYVDTRALVFCHQCTTRTTVPYHWLALKCGLCLSYNTSHIETINAPGATQRHIESTATPRQNTDNTGEVSEIALGQAPPPLPDQVTETVGQIRQAPITDIQAALVQQAIVARSSALRFVEDPVSPSSDEDNSPELCDEIQNSESPTSDAVPNSAQPIQPIQELNADGVERFLQQFDQDLDQDILHFWDNDDDDDDNNNNNGPSTVVGSLTRNALNTLQQAIHNNLLDSNDPAGVARMTRNALNSFQQVLQNRLDNDSDDSSDESLRRNTLTILHNALHGNVVDSDEEEEEVSPSVEREPGQVGFERDDDEEQNGDDASSAADSLFAYEDPETDFFLPGHR